MEEYLNFLGLKVKNKVTGFTGIVISISFDLFGCIQGLVQAGLEKSNKFSEERFWFDLNRLQIINKKPVMEIPDYQNMYQTEKKQKKIIVKNGKGPANKPTNI